MYVPSALDQWTTRGAHVLGDQESILSFSLPPLPLGGSGFMSASNRTYIALKSTEGNGII